MVGYYSSYNIIMQIRTYENQVDYARIVCRDELVHHRGHIRTRSYGTLHDAMSCARSLRDKSKFRKERLMKSYWMAASFISRGIVHQSLIMSNMDDDEWTTGSFNNGFKKATMRYGISAPSVITGLWRDPRHPPETRRSSLPVCPWVVESK